MNICVPWYVACATMRTYRGFFRCQDCRDLVQLLFHGIVFDAQRLQFFVAVLKRLHAGLFLRQLHTHTRTHARTRARTRRAMVPPVRKQKRLVVGKFSSRSTSIHTQQDRKPAAHIGGRTVVKASTQPRQNTVTDCQRATRTTVSASSSG